MLLAAFVLIPHGTILISALSFLANRFLTSLRKPLAIVTLSGIVAMKVSEIPYLMIIRLYSLNDLTSQSPVFHQWNFYLQEELVQGLSPYTQPRIIMIFSFQFSKLFPFSIRIELTLADIINAETIAIRMNKKIPYKNPQ